MRKLLALVVTIIATGAVLAGTVIALVPSARQVAASAGGDPEDIDLAALDNYAVRSEVFSADGKLFATLHGPENRQPVALDQVPQPVIDAILAVEDADFYDHNGVNFRSMTRALFENVSAGGIEQGGSTITQQLIKNALLTSDRDISRKSKEIPLALRLEQQLTKDQILEKYLNTVYFGAGAYGVQAAAEVYWGVDVGQLGYPEAALLAALIANPVVYDPTLHPQAAYEQRRKALDRMIGTGVITRDDAATYGSAPLPVRRCGADEPNRPTSCGDVEPPETNNYFLEEVKQQLLNDDRLGATRDERISQLFGGGLRIYTTIDPKMQLAAELAHASGVPANNKGVTAAIVSIDNATGGVRALVGGPGYETFQYDVATLSPGRQTGSSFKGFTLLTALEQGNLPFDTIGGGASFANPGGTPNPYKVDGPGGTLTFVTQKSSNGAFVRLEQVVGLNNVIDTAHRLGVSTDLQPDLSLTLGTFDITPLEMASAYSTIPDKGTRQPAYFVDRVEDRNGKVLLSHSPDPQPGVSEKTACYATQILQENVKGGTGTRARLAKQDAAGKTGTTNDNLDAWFVGFTPYYTTAVWMGDPSPDKDNPLASSMKNLNGVENFGGTYPAMIWKKFNEAVHTDLPVVHFPECPKLDRSARPVVGQGNPFLNGVRFSKDGKIIGSGPKPSTTSTTTPDGDTPAGDTPKPTTSTPKGG